LTIAKYQLSNEVLKEKKSNSHCPSIIGFKAHDPYIIVEAIISNLVNSIIADCLPNVGE